MEKRKLVQGKEVVIDLEDIFDRTSPEEAIDKLIEICNNTGGEQHKFSVEYYLADEPYILLTSFRFETDKEYERRLNAEKKAKEKKALLKKKQEESEKKEYERLKKKYENS